jgi:hypothetical protein
MSSAIAKKRNTAAFPLLVTQLPCQGYLLIHFRPKTRLAKKSKTEISSGPKGITKVSTVGTWAAGT